MYEKGKLSERQLAMLHRVLRVMRERNRITDQELSIALAEPLVFHREGDPLPESRPPVVRNTHPFNVISDNNENKIEETNDVY